jgi:hypothetical protein
MKFSGRLLILLAFLQVACADALQENYEGRT